ncbi:MAG: GDSL-type esterase/lipase family protein [Lachnospiraceae bacterium]
MRLKKRAGISEEHAVPSQEGTGVLGESTTEEETDVKLYIPNTDNVKTIGRTYLLEDTLWMAFSGSGAEFQFSGKKVTITLTGDNTSMLSSRADDQARIAIYVNGERVVDDMMDEAEKSYTVFDSDTAAECDIKVIKLSETAMSTVGIKSIEVDGEAEIAPAGAKEHFIEFVGDSITCGYGVDDEDRDHHFSTKTEDVTRAYAYKTAEALDADYSMVSISGYGIISGYTGDGSEKISVQTLPQYYDKLGFSYGQYMGKTPADIEWGFTDYTPDLIVINLGTNDDSYTLDYEDRQEEYRAAYVEFLKEVRSHNPEATILCVLGIMGDRLYPTVEQAVADYTAETGDENISSMKFDVQLPSDGYVADWHPTAVTHDKAAEKLTNYIQELMGW